MNTYEKLHVDHGSGTIDIKRYRSLIGRLLYLSCDHRNIMQVDGLVSRFMPNPSRHHLGATNRILKYGIGKLNYGI